MICPLKQEKIQFDVSYGGSAEDREFSLEIAIDDFIYVLHYQTLKKEYWYFPDVEELRGEYAELYAVEKYVNGELEDLNLEEFSDEILENFIMQCDKDAEWQIGNWEA